METPLLSSAHIPAPFLDSVRSLGAGWHLAGLRAPEHRHEPRRPRRALAAIPGRGDEAHHLALWVLELH